jgi:hypothetical protein
LLGLSSGLWWAADAGMSSDQYQMSEVQCLGTTEAAQIHVTLLLMVFALVLIVQAVSMKFPNVVEMGLFPGSVMAS